MQKHTHMQRCDGGGRVFRIKRDRLYILKLSSLCSVAVPDRGTQKILFTKILSDR